MWGVAEKKWVRDLEVTTGNLEVHIEDVLPKLGPSLREKPEK